jgi:mRNA interferase RelE/StbE
VSSLPIIWEEQAISQAAGFLDDPQGLEEAPDAVGRLADHPRPSGSFPYGSPDRRRLRAGRYCVLYEITNDTISIVHVARVPIRSQVSGPKDL